MIEWKEVDGQKVVSFMDNEGLDELRRKPVQPDMFLLGNIIKFEEEDNGVGRRNKRPAKVQKMRVR